MGTLQKPEEFARQRKEAAQAAVRREREVLSRAKQEMKRGGKAHPSGLMSFS